MATETVSEISKVHTYGRVMVLLKYVRDKLQSQSCREREGEGERDVGYS